MGTNKKEEKREIFSKPKSAAEQMLDPTLPSLETQSIQEEDKVKAEKKELVRMTSYMRPAQQIFLYQFCDDLQKDFNNRSIQPPLLIRALVDLCDEEMKAKLKNRLQELGYNKSK